MYLRTNKDIDVSGCHASRRDMLAPCPQGCEVYVYTLPKGARPDTELYAGPVEALYELCKKWRLLLPELAQISKLLQSGHEPLLPQPPVLPCCAQRMCVWEGLCTSTHHRSTQPYYTCNSFSSRTTLTPFALTWHMPPHKLTHVLWSHKRIH